MSVSVFDLFSIGMGPSSSHTVGPMRAAKRFLLGLTVPLQSVASVKVDLYGSLALTGKGHGTDIAVMMGLLGEQPSTVDPDTVPRKIGAIVSTQKLALMGEQSIRFNPAEHLLFHHDQVKEKHANGMSFAAFDAEGQLLSEQVYYSIGGGFVVSDAEFDQDNLVQDEHVLPYPFQTGKELLILCHQHKMSIAELMLENEKAWRTPSEIDEGLMKIWAVMEACIQRGRRETGMLPGGLKVARRAHLLEQKLKEQNSTDMMNWINLYALAVNEENAAGGRVVTAPTNGAAGIIPAVMAFYHQFEAPLNVQSVRDFMLTAGAIGLLFKQGASISAAEVGCQGEVGVACSMAAAGLCALYGGTPEQIENAAEMGMEHHLGLTCDPIGGLVQIPCIERNTMGSVQAVNCAKLAMMGDGQHLVSLDAVIKTMLETGQDMQSKYKETAMGGLAVNQPAC